MNYNTNNFNKLLSDLKRMPLVLFVGAGVNFPIIPLWKPLLKQLLGLAADKIIGSSKSDYRLRPDLVKELESMSEYEQATIAKSVLGKNFFRYLKSILYSDYIKLRPKGVEFHSDKLICKNGKGPLFLNIVRDLCDNYHIQAIVSYNYDDILLNAIKTNAKRRVYCVQGSKQPDNFDQKNLPIYYVHGFIPCTGRLPSLDGKNLVLSREEYFRIMLEPYSWQTTVQLYFLQNYEPIPKNHFTVSLP